MVENERSDKVVPQSSVTEYFHESIDAAMSNQSLEAEPTTVYYVVNLLTSFTRSENFYERSDDGLSLKPLALIYADALEGATPEERHRALRRLGDVALFISGLFSQSLNRKVVDVDYYIAMGGSAYGYLSNSLRGTLHGEALSDVFDELSNKFTDFVEVLGEVGDCSALSNDRDIMRAYELWIKTGSRRAARQLKNAGIYPNQAALSGAHH